VQDDYMTCYIVVLQSTEGKRTCPSAGNEVGFFLFNLKTLLPFTQAWAGESAWFEEENKKWW